MLSLCHEVHAGTLDAQFGQQKKNIWTDAETLFQSHIDVNVCVTMKVFFCFF